jgi:5-methyltetrahydrofolate--homocysteine methyltransferase
MDVQLYKKLLSDKILVFDGAMGTNLQRFNPTVDDYWGNEGCTEVLCFSHPDWLEEVHAGFLKAGCDVIETNSFGANRLVLSEFNLGDKALEYNRVAAQLAKKICSQFSTPAQPRYVAGSMGPGTKLPSLGHIDFDTLRVNYAEQAQGLLEGGADLLLIETCQDLLQVKAAINGSLDAMKKTKIRVPLNVQVTIEATGTMLVGSDMATAITVIECFPVDTIGLNCATGPREMSEHVRTLGQLTNRYISVLPNAGLPENVGGRAVYRLTPQGPGRSFGGVRDPAWGQCGGRLLRHHAGTFAGGGAGSFQIVSQKAGSQKNRPGGQLVHEHAHSPGTAAHDHR